MGDPWYIVLAGPNGAGKTTLADVLIEPDVPYINPDIVGGKATRLIRQRLVDERRSFALETNLADKGAMRWAKDAIRSGFNVRLLYVGVESIDICQERVQKRGETGGHTLHRAYIQKRYKNGLENLAVLTPFAKAGELVDNSGKKHRLVARIEEGKLIQLEKCTWLEKAFPAQEHPIKQSTRDDDLGR